LRNLIPYSIFGALSILVFSLSLHFIKSMSEPVPELHISMKTFATSTIELRSRADTNAQYSKEPTKQILNSSQFFKPIILSFDKADELMNARIDFDNKANTILIENMYLVSKLGGNRDTFIKWNGLYVDSLVRLYNNITIETKNESFIQFKCGETDPYIEFNSKLLQIFKSQQNNSSMHSAINILAAILLTFTFMMIFRFLIAPNAVDLFKNMLVKGYILIFVFMGILFITYFNNQWHILPDVANKENRALAAKPNLTPTQFFEYPELFTKYAKDNYSFRNLFFYIHAIFKSKVLHVSPLPDDAILGKKNWFFDNAPSVTMDFRKIQPFDTNQLFITTQILTQRQNWLSKRNIKFYILITPNKNRVYPELMPSSYEIMEGRGYNYFDLLNMHLRNNSNLSLIDPTEALKLAKQHLDVYYSTDTHWNLYGGFIGYHVLMNEMKKDFPLLKPADVTEFDYAYYYNSEGDLAKMCGLQDVFQRQEMVMKFKDPNKQLNNPLSSSILLHYSNTNRVDSSNLNVVMFRDSYANYLIPFLNLHFKEVEYIWSYEFLDQIIEEKKPDVVIFESLQRFMSYALTMPNSKEVVENK